MKAVASIVWYSCFFIEQQLLLLSIFGRFLLGKPSFDEPNSSNKWAILFFTKISSHTRESVWWPWWFLLLLLWRNLQFLLFTLPVCVKKTPGVGGTLLQTNDRHTSQGGIIASRSLSLSLLFSRSSARPNLLPPPSRPKLLATRRELCAWMILQQVARVCELPKEEENAHLSPPPLYY